MLNAIKSAKSTATRHGHTPSSSQQANIPQLFQSKHPTTEDVFQGKSLHFAGIGKPIKLTQPRLIIDDKADLNGALLRLCAHPKVTVQYLARLIQAGAIPSAQDNSLLRYTPLHFLAQNNAVTPELLKVLLKEGADPNQANYFGRRPLHLLAENNAVTPQLLKVLLEKGANPNLANSSDETPLHYLAHNQAVTPALLQTLLDAGANPNQADFRGATPLQHLAHNPAVTPATIQTLLDMGANPNQEDKSGNTAWDYLTRNPARTEETLRLLQSAIETPDQAIKDRLLQTCLSDTEAIHPELIIEILRRKARFPFERDIPIEELSLLPLPVRVNTPEAQAYFKQQFGRNQAPDIVRRLLIAEIEPDMDALLRHDEPKYPALTDAKQKQARHAMAAKMVEATLEPEQPLKSKVRTWLKKILSPF